ncbi:MAG: signal peptidase I [Eubacteriales bacterium]|jgi:signal peptidase I|nr:signal peptidase I [Clostridiales bacterium]
MDENSVGVNNNKPDLNEIFITPDDDGPNDKKINIDESKDNSSENATTSGTEETSYEEKPQDLPSDGSTDSSDDNGEEKVSLIKFLFDIVETLAISTCAVVLVFTIIVRLAIVDGPSMRHTLENSDALLVSNLFFEPKYGDIVVFTSDNFDKPLVKRVIATEGQVVDIDFETWAVTVDGVLIDESDYIYIDPNSRAFSDVEYPFTVPAGYVFVMGDNRNHSTDSRDTRVGPVDTRRIIGRVICRIAPISKIKVFERFS